MELTHLPPEILLRIFERCPRTDLPSLSRTCRRMQNISTPLIYREVDLSTHNRVSVRSIDGIYEPGDWVIRRYDDRDGVVCGKQLAFVRSLRESPHLGQHVRILRWSAICMPNDVYKAAVVPLQQRLAEKQLSTDDYRTAMGELEFNDGGPVLWRTFSLLTNVRTVDLAFMSGNMEREAAPPPPLFRSAQEIRLSGMASRFLVASILDGLSPDLLALSLNNLNQFAELEGVDQRLAIEAKGRIRPFPSQIGMPGPMHEHLEPYCNKFRRLQHLEISTVGQAAPPMQGLVIWDEEVEEKRYAELGAFIRHASSSLRSLTFQQGVTGDPTVDGWRRLAASTRMYPAFAGKRPMDQRFETHILPAILGSEWPKLELLRLRGVASSSAPDETAAPEDYRVLNRPLRDAAMAQIRAAVGPRANLDVTPDATRVYWMADEYFGSGIPELDSENEM